MRIFDTRAGRLDLPRQFHPHALQLRLGGQRPRPRGRGPGRGKVADRARGDGPRDGEHGLLPRRGVGIRDDMYLGEGNKYMREVAAAVEEGYREGVLHQRPSVINLQCDIDHPTQSVADLAHLKDHFGSLEALRGKKMAMTWAYSPSYGKPLSVPQGIIGLDEPVRHDGRLASPKATASSRMSSISPGRTARRAEGPSRSPLDGRGVSRRRHRLSQVLGPVRGDAPAHPPAKEGTRPA